MAKSKGKDLFYIPGGKKEAGETDIQALTRETFEELGVSLIPSTAKEVFTLEAQAHGKPEGVMCRFLCISADLVGEPFPSSEVEELRYLDTSQSNLTPEAGVLILQQLQKLDLID